MEKKTIRIGGASGYWGDAAMATPQLLAAPQLDYLVYDYLAEITMSIMARARAKNAELGYATDFVHSAMAANLPSIAERKVKVIANAGGVNPRACAAALRKLVAEQELDLKVAVVLGDDLIDRKDALAGSGVVEMFSGSAFPHVDSVASINAYLGAFPIAAALDAGADIVITGRCVDSAVTLGACIHEFHWAPSDYDRLAAGSLAGHILECGTQTSGGNFTDWEEVAGSLVDAGYPIAEIATDGTFVCTKAPGSGGLVSVGTVAEQMLYEIGDPCAYVLPDVVCDFSQVRMRQSAPQRVEVSNAAGAPPPANYKVSATYADGFRGGEIRTVYGRDAERKAQRIAETVLTRSGRALQSKGLPPYSESCVEIIGAESHYGEARRTREVREVDLKVAVRHPSGEGVRVFFKEMVGAALASPPGLTGFAGGRPRPSPVVRLFSFLLPKSEVEITVEFDGVELNGLELDRAVLALDTATSELASEVASGTTDPAAAHLALEQEETVAVTLERLAWARSGDKGDKANIGVIARDPRYMPYIQAAITPELVAARFSHFLEGKVECFSLPGLPALNFLLHEVLGGGGIASLRNDPQGKATAKFY